MYCTSCGRALEEDVVTCPSCLNAVAYNGPRPTVRSWLVESILMCFCCCTPLGIPAIVFAAQVKPKLDHGDYQGAEMSSRYAKNLCLVGFGLWALGALAYGILILIALVTEGA